MKVAFAKKAIYNTIFIFPYNVPVATSVFTNAILNLFTIQK